jgi:hypothetical protein
MNINILNRSESFSPMQYCLQKPIINCQVIQSFYIKKKSHRIKKISIKSFLINFCFSFCFSGLRILAFPCNQFGYQEPGNAEEIQCFVRDRKVKFDLFEKIDVNGKGAHPLYQYLKKEQGGTLFDAIKWNFTKFIVDKNGKPVERHSPNTSPKEMLKNLEKYF